MARSGRRWAALCTAALLTGGASLAAAVPSSAAPNINGAPGDAFTVESDDLSLAMTSTGDRVLWFWQEGASFDVAGEQRYSTGVARQWWHLTLTPPQGSRFESGHTYTTDPQSPDGPADLFLGGNGSSCSGSAVITVRTATYDDAGALATLAADYDLTCPDPLDEHFTGVVRWRSAEPWTAVEADPLPSSILVVDERQTRTVTLRNRGTADLHPSAVDISGDAADDWTLTDDGCVGLLPAGSQCDLVLALRPTTAAPSRSADLTVTDDSVRGRHRVRLTTASSPSAHPWTCRPPGRSRASSSRGAPDPAGAPRGTSSNVTPGTAAAPAWRSCPQGAPRTPTPGPTTPTSGTACWPCRTAPGVPAVHRGRRPSRQPRPRRCRHLRRIGPRGGRRAGEHRAVTGRSTSVHGPGAVGEPAG